MNKLRIILIVLLLIYAPLFVVMFFNLVPPFTTFDVASFLNTAVITALILFIIFSLFLIILQAMPEKFRLVYTALFVFLYMVFVLAFFCVISNEAPDLAGVIANLSVTPTLFLLCALWIICIITGALMFLLRVDKKTSACICCGVVILSSGFVTAKELHFRYKTADFFDGYREGRIVFATSYTIDQKPYVFCLADLKFKRFSENEFERIRNKPRCLTTKTFSPDSNFMVYEYAYDKEDLSKIFVTNLKTGQTILLAAGEDPVWVE